MKLKNILNEDLVKIDLKGNDKSEIINELLEVLVENGKLKDKDLAFKNIMDREQQPNTQIRCFYFNTSAIRIDCILIKI